MARNDSFRLRFFGRSIVWLAFAGATTWFTGCSSITGTREPSLDTSAVRAAGYQFDESGMLKTAPQAEGKPSIILEVRDRKKHTERIPLNDEQPLFVQDLVDDAKLVQRLGRIRISILRPMGGQYSPPVRMDVDFDRDGKRIEKWQNYALKPGDQVIVSKDTRSWVDNLNPFGPKK